MRRPAPWDEIVARLRASAPFVELARRLEGGRASATRLPPPAAAWVADLLAERSRRLQIVVVPHEADGWRHALDSLVDFFERVSTLDPGIAPPPRTDWRSAPPLAPSPLDELMPDELDAARLLVILKGTNAHDYKYSSALLEDYYHVSPSWRKHCLAGGIFLLRGSSLNDNRLVQRTRSALA